MSPEYVQPHVKAQKTDDRDAGGDRGGGDPADPAPGHFESEAQLDLQVLHRARQRLVSART